jgi:hypothetical protein
MEPGAQGRVPAFFPAVCPENLKRFTDLNFFAIIFILDEWTSAPANVLW